MQVIEKQNDGLKRELEIVIAAGELDQKLVARLDDMKQRVQIKGFRPGKVPVDHIRKIYGRSVMAEVLQETVNETSRKAISERQERPAFEPEINLTEDKDEIEQIMDGKSDLAYTMVFEILPDFELTDLSQIKIEKQISEVSEEDIKKGLDQLLENSTTYESVDRAAQNEDRLKIDFVGKIDGEPFDGGQAENSFVVLGKGQFIPGFEEGLIGAKKDQSLEVKTTFPDEYTVNELKGKEAIFEVTVGEVAGPFKAKLDEEFAKGLGFDSTDKLEEGIKSKLQEDLDQLSRNSLKKNLLDILDEAYQFELPAKLVDNEFESIWSQVNAEMEQVGRTFEDENLTQDTAREKYQKVAKRRVRLGLVVSEIGRKNDIQISDEEVQKALMQRVSQYPGQEKDILTYYQKNPQALAELRAPIYEDKVIDFILELAQVTDKKVASEELAKPLDEEE